MTGSICVSLGRRGGRAHHEAGGVDPLDGSEVAREVDAVGRPAKLSVPRLLPNSRRKRALPVTTTNHHPGNNDLILCRGNR